jgi:hypothetical protein
MLLLGPAEHFFAVVYVKITIVVIAPVLAVGLRACVAGVAVDVVTKLVQDGIEAFTFTLL